MKNVEITEKTEHVYRIRHRNNWSKADSLYDAWLLSKKLYRDWFPAEDFLNKHLDLVRKRKVLKFYSLLLPLLNFSLLYSIGN